jgi:hypothetical protein
MTHINLFFQVTPIFHRQQKNYENFELHFWQKTLIGLCFVNPKFTPLHAKELKIHSQICTHIAPSIKYLFTSLWHPNYKSNLNLNPQPIETQM